MGWGHGLNILAVLKGVAHRPGQNMDTKDLDFYIDLSVLTVPSLCDGGPGPLLQFPVNRDNGSRLVEDLLLSSVLTHD